MKNTIITLVFVAISLSIFAQTGSQEVLIRVEPGISKAILGHLELKREKYFNICHGGKGFESTINDMKRSDHYLGYLEMSFGRSLDLVYGEKNWGNSLKEDVNRSGYADINYLRSKLKPDDGNPSALFRNRFPVNLGVANHDRPMAYPSFMQQTTTSQAGDEGKLPVNTDAAAELVVALLKYKYTDWTRPATFEAINEPHWSLWSANPNLLADLHTAIWEKAKKEALPTLIGGPCFSVAYYYKNNYQYFSNLSKFIDNTRCQLDFYSFHVYDFLRWNNTRNDFHGRVTSGLPLEGVLDLVPGYTRNKYGKPVELVVSEHGGYISTNADSDLDLVANKYFPGSGFEWEMKRRSVSDFIMVSSSIASTMVYMNHPHVVKKAVPFILLESFAWDPKYYASLLVAKNYTDKTQWQETKLIHFFEFFKDVKGRRVWSECDNPDIQQQSFVNNNKLLVVINNLSTKTFPLDLKVPVEKVQSVQIRRFGRKPDFTPYLEETGVTSLNGLELKGREAMVITVTCQETIRETQYLNEKPFYGTEVTRQFTGSSTFTVDVPDPEKAEYAYLRIGLSRPVGTDRKVNISLNGVFLTVPHEDCADYLEDIDEFATTKIIRIDKSILQKNNQIMVSFPDGKTGGVGAVVLRAAYSEINPESSSSTVVLPDYRLEPILYPNPVTDSYIKIDFTEPVTDVDVKLFNLAGVLLSEKKFNGDVNFYIGNIQTSGIYLIKITTNHLSFTRKIMIDNSKFRIMTMNTTNSNKEVISSLNTYKS